VSAREERSNGIPLCLCVSVSPVARAEGRAKIRIFQRRRPSCALSRKTCFSWAWRVAGAGRRRFTVTPASWSSYESVGHLRLSLGSQRSSSVSPAPPCCRPRRARRIEPGHPAPNFSPSTRRARRIPEGVSRQDRGSRMDEQRLPFVRKHYDSGNMQKLQKRLHGGRASFGSRFPRARAASRARRRRRPRRMDCVPKSRADRAAHGSDGKLGHLYGAKDDGRTCS